MSAKIYIVDTSYLVELFAVPDKSEKTAVTEVRRRFEGGIRARATFFVPLPCVFELANHVAHIANGHQRTQVAGRVCQTVAASLEDNGPWTITPAKELGEILPEMFRRFSREFIQQGVGLTDAAVIFEAERAKTTYSTRRDCEVHIWTRDGSVKAREPDEEEIPFV